MNASLHQENDEVGLFCLKNILSLIIILFTFSLLRFREPITCS